jgi:pimeloyl-ACP methyl ester carboxylesterase
VQVVVNPSAFEWRNRRIVALSSVQDIAIRGLANRYRRPGVGAPLAASTQPIVAEQGMQVAPRMKLPMTAALRLDAPRRQLAQRELRATLDPYNTYDVATTTIGGKTVPLEADDTAVLAYVLALPEIWERELKAFFSGVFSEATPTQLASIDVYRPGRIPVVFVHGTASSAGRWGDMVNDLLDDPGIRERYQFWFFTYDTGNPVLYSAALLREALRDALHKLDPAGVDPALSEIVVIGHSQGGLLTKAMVVDTGDRLWNAIANKPLGQIDLSPERRELLREAVFIKPVPNVRRVVFIATPHPGSYLTEYPVTELLGRFLTLPVRIVQTGAELARNAGDFKVNPRNLGSGSLFGMTPNNPVLQTMSTTPIAPGVRKQQLGEALARVDAQRDKLTIELSELEATERVLARYSKGTRARKTASSKTETTLQGPPCLVLGAPYSPSGPVDRAARPHGTHPIGRHLRPSEGRPERGWSYLARGTESSRVCVSIGRSRGSATRSTQSGARTWKIGLAAITARTRSGA